MSHFRQAFSFGLVFSCLAAGSTAAEQANRGRVGQAPGVLAIATDSAPAWRIAHQGDVLPDDCRLCTAAGDASLVDLPDAVLHVAPSTRLRLKCRQRLAALESGRVFLQTKGQTKWSVAATGLHLALDKDSAAEWTVEPGEPSVIHVMAGSVVLTSDGRKPCKILTGNSIVFNQDEGTLDDEHPLSAEERKRIESWTAPGKSAQGLGQLLIEDAQSGATRRLNVARYHVNVVLQPPVALVQIDQSFYNPSVRQEEGTFVFNLPRGASVSRFAMYVTPSRLIEGELIERQRASNIYQSIVNRKRDPAILEQIGDNLFRMRVFPIFARDTKRILLDYTLPLEDDDGLCRLRLPLMSDLQPIWDFRISGSIFGPTRPDSLVSRSHGEIAFQQSDDGTISFDLVKKNYRPKSDFSLRFSQPAEGDAALRSCVAEPLPPRDNPRGAVIDDPYRGRRATHFRATVEPVAEAAPGGEPPAADVLILADTSSGMRKSKSVGQSVRTIVHGLRPSDRFRIMCVDVAAREIHDGWITPGGAEARAAVAGFRKQFCLGATDLATGIEEALKSFDGRDRRRRRLVVYVGDGEDTSISIDRDQLPGELAGRLEKAHAALFGVIVRRSETGRPLLESVARATGGLVFDTTGLGHADADLFRWLLAGAPSPLPIVDVEVEGATREDLYLPTAWLPTEKLHVVGRTLATDKLRLKLTIVRDGKPITVQREFDIDSRRDDVFIGRFWAQRKLDRLRREGDAEKNRQSIVALSQQWSLLSPHTAFLVLETEQDYQFWDIDRRQRRRYWKPPGALPRSPLPDEWLRLVMPEAEEESSPGTPFPGLPPAWRMGPNATLPQLLGRAREELDQENIATALRLLARAKRTFDVAASPEYAQLYGRATAGVETESLLRLLGSQRGLLDPAAVRWPTGYRPSISPLLGPSSRTNAAFLLRYPYSPQLLKEVGVTTDGWDLKAWAETLADYTGANVVLDRKALNDVGIEVDQPLTSPGWGRMSLRNCVKFTLAQDDLVLVEEPHRLLITTPEEAETRLTTEVYPLADLLLTDRVADLDLLVNPYHDHETAVNARIRSKLMQPTSVEFVEKPLAEVARHFAKQLDEAVLIDSRALDQVGIGGDTPVSASLHDVPAKHLLHWILDEFELTYSVRGEALIITTPEEEECYLTTRLHSGRGVVYEYPVPEGSIGGYGGMGGGMGMGMGMGGMAIGGGMGGSFGGGMGGGMGGAMGMGGMGMGGSFGGGMGGAMGGIAQSTEVGLSSGGDATDATEETDDSAAEPDPTPEVDIAAGDEEPIDVEQTQQVDQRYEYDVDSPIELITSTIGPNTWDEVGGPGSLAFAPWTLDFVISTTEEVHDQIESLLARLRQLPSRVDQTNGVRPATVHPSAPNGVSLLPRTFSFDWDTLIEIVTSTIQPNTWEDVGGPGSIAAHEPRMALVVSTTDDVHEDLSNLLMMLRRSRYVSLRSGKPWELGAVPLSESMLERWTSDAENVPRLSDLPKPKPAELDALAVRRVPPAGQWKWRRQQPDGGDREEVSLRRSGDRIEMQWANFTVRTEGDAVAVACPGLALVEHENKAEVARRLADGWLPWLPHRGNEELARLFDVRTIEAADEVAAEQPGTTRLRMVPQGISDRGGTYIEATFSTKDGRPQSWESYLQGKRTGRLKFSDPLDENSVSPCKTIVLEDGDGKPLMQWELVESRPKSPRIPELAAGWKGYVQLDRRAERASVDAPLQRAVVAMREAHWPAAISELKATEKTHPRHPLLVVLRAWCFEYDRSGDGRDEIVATLMHVAAETEATAVIRFIGEGGLEWLEPADRYKILAHTPAAGREAIDCDQLTEAAIDAERLEDALLHAEAALNAKAFDGKEFQRERIRVKLLLDLGRSSEANKAAERWAARARPTVRQLAEVAELLAKFSQTQPADRLFVQALAADGLPEQERCALLRRRASILSGLPRWKALLEAAAMLPVDADERQRYVSTLLGELVSSEHAETAALLAGETEDRQLEGRLQVRRAELTADPAAAGDLWWKLSNSGRLPEDRITMACGTWNYAKQHDRVIAQCERRLRAGKELPLETAYELEEAYRAAGRENDARRVASEDPGPQPPLDTAPNRGMGGGFF